MSSRVYNYNATMGGGEVGDDNSDNGWETWSPKQIKVHHVSNIYKITACGLGCSIVGEKKKYIFVGKRRSSGQ